MDKIYYLCEFNYGGEGTFYLVAENGIVQYLINTDGTTLELASAYGYIIVDPIGLINIQLP